MEDLFLSTVILFIVLFADYKFLKQFDPIIGKRVLKTKRFVFEMILLVLCYLAFNAGGYEALFLTIFILGLLLLVGRPLMGLIDTAKKQYDWLEDQREQNKRKAQEKGPKTYYHP